MSGTVVVLVDGEVLANQKNSTITAQRENTMKLAKGLLPLLASDSRVVVLHGNKPQVGFVLFRSELASHILHGIPLDVCGADTQGATGFMLSQAFTNVLKRAALQRRVMCIMTQTRVDNSHGEARQLRAIGPWFDREKAEQHRQTRGWTMVEEPGRGYRRAVPSLPAIEIMEFDGIKQLVHSGTIVIAAGGGGVPVIENAQGDYEGIEAVLQTEQVAVLMARGLKANVILNVIDSDNKFALSGMRTETENWLSLEQLNTLLEREIFNSNAVYSKLRAASEFLHSGGEQMVFTTLRKLPETLAKKNGLRIGTSDPSVELFKIGERKN